MLRHLILLAGIAGLFFVCHSREWTTSVAAQAAFEVSFIAGSRDDAGRFMGGTELRILTAHAGKLYAGNGYWEDRPGPEGPQGAQVLVLDGSAAPWRVDHSFDERMPSGRPRNLAVSALSEVTFA